MHHQPILHRMMMHRAEIEVLKVVGLSRWRLFFFLVTKKKKKDFSSSCFPFFSSLLFVWGKDFERVFSFFQVGEHILCCFIKTTNNVCSDRAPSMSISEHCCFEHVLENQLTVTFNNSPYVALRCTVPLLKSLHWPGRTSVVYVGKRLLSDWALQESKSLAENIVWTEEKCKPQERSQSSSIEILL